MSGGASSVLRCKSDLVAEDGLTGSPQCTLQPTPCRYTERTPIAHVREKVTTMSGQPLYSEFFELLPPASSLPPLSSSPLHRCRLGSTFVDPAPSCAASAVVSPETDRLLHRTDCGVYGHVSGGLAATTGRGRCRQHYRAVSPRRAVSTDRLLNGKDVAVDTVTSRGHRNTGGGAPASPDLLPGSDLESLVNTSAH